jgi:hypothetical protein
MLLSHYGSVTAHATEMPGSTVLARVHIVQHRGKHHKESIDLRDLSAKELRDLSRFLETAADELDRPADETT